MAGDHFGSFFNYSQRPFLSTAIHKKAQCVFIRPAENFKVSKAQTPFNFLGQKESIPQILGHLAVI